MEALFYVEGNKIALVAVEMSMQWRETIVKYLMFVKFVEFKSCQVCIINYEHLFFFNVGTRLGALFTIINNRDTVIHSLTVNGEIWVRLEFI
jgi:hypothetical protein